MVTRADEQLAFTIDELGALRALVSRVASLTSLERERIHDLVLAVSELASNSVLHGGGEGVLRVWVQDEEALHCEVRDEGHIGEHAVVRDCPAPTACGGRGLWLADHLCDGLAIDSSAGTGSVVHVHMRLPGASA